MPEESTVPPTPPPLPPPVALPKSPSRPVPPTANVNEVPADAHTDKARRERAAASAEKRARLEQARGIGNVDVVRRKKRSSEAMKKL